MYLSVSSIYCFYLIIHVNLEKQHRKKIILHIHPGYVMCFYLEFMLFEHLVEKSFKFLLCCFHNC